MSNDLTRDELARLVAQVEKQRTYKAITFDLPREMAVSLLALASEALDAREALRFVRVVAIRAMAVWRALAADGMQYEIRKIDDGVYEWNASNPMGDLRRAASYTEAIEAAREHDLRRRGVKS